MIIAPLLEHASKFMYLECLKMTSVGIGAICYQIICCYIISKLFHKFSKRIVVSKIIFLGQRNLSMTQLYKSCSCHMTNEVYNHASNSTRRLWHFSQWMCLMVMIFYDVCVCHQSVIGSWWVNTVGMAIHLMLLVSRDEIKHVECSTEGLQQGVIGSRYQLLCKHAFFVTRKKHTTFT